MKKLMLALLCIGMHMQGFTITQVGTEKDVAGIIGYDETPKSVFTKKFVLRDGEFEDTHIPGRSESKIQLQSPVNKLIDVSSLTDLEKQSPYTICVINVNANPVRISLYRDKNGDLLKKYKAKEAVLEEKMKKLKQEMSELKAEKNKHIKQIIDGQAELKAAIPEEA